MFLLDTNVFIQAKNQYYAFDLCPSFWRTLLEHPEISSIRQVRKELMDGRDELKDWAREHRDLFPKFEDPQTQHHFIEITDLVTGKPFTQRAKDRFLNVADPWLIAPARTEQATVVTLEEADAQALRRVPIPTICHYFNVRCIKTWDMLRELRIIL